MGVKIVQQKYLPKYNSTCTLKIIINNILVINSSVHAYLNIIEIVFKAVQWRPLEATKNTTMRTDYTNISCDPRCDNVTIWK